MKHGLAVLDYKVLCLARTFLSSALSRTVAIKCHCVIPVHMDRCLQCPQASEISTKAAFEADFRFPTSCPCQNYLGGGQQSCPDTSLAVASVREGSLLVAVPGPWQTFALTLRKRFRTLVKVPMSRAGGKGLISTKREQASTHLGILGAWGTLSFRVDEAQCFIWLCSRI